MLSSLQKLRGFLRYRLEAIVLHRQTDRRTDGRTQINIPFQWKRGTKPQKNQEVLHLKKGKTELFQTIFLDLDISQLIAFY